MCLRTEFIVLGLLLILPMCYSETEMATCTFYYWRVSWQSASRTCRRDGKELLCYRSKAEIDDITEAFRISTNGADTELELWLANKNCSGRNRYEECLSLHITKSSKGVWHYFEEECDEHFPFVCCPGGQAKGTSTVSLTSADHGSRDNATLPTTLHPIFCKQVLNRGILWPDTQEGSYSIQPCPGNSIGRARWQCTNSSTGAWDIQGPNLTECRNLQIMELRAKFNTTSSMEILSTIDDTFKDQEIFAEDLIDIITILATLPQKLSDSTDQQPNSERWLNTKEVVEKSTSVFDHIIELNETWQELPEERRSTAGTSLLSTVEGLGLVYADTMVDIQPQSVIGKNIALQVVNPLQGQALQLPQWGVTSAYGARGSLRLEEGFDSLLDPANGSVSVVFVLYSNMGCILSPGRNESNSHIFGSLNSAVVSATVAQGKTAAPIHSHVIILVEHITRNPNHSACVYWNMLTSEWDTQGCTLQFSNASHSECVCDHLTNFAVLMDFRGVLQDRDGDHLTFTYITVVGCSLSVICLAVCVVVFSFYSYHSKHAWGLRYVIHRNLCFTLLVANLVLVIGLDKTGNPGVCAVIAGVLHYAFLCAFSWMFLEGVHIYLLLVIVFASRRSHWEKYYIFGYGCPLVIVTITALSRPNYYGTVYACWLSTEKGTIWAFMGPVAVILMMNLAALVLAQWKASSISNKDDSMALVKRWLRVTFILFPVLGITWIFGFMYVGKRFEVAGYIFAILNSLQGFCIFVCHCVLDQKARNSVIASFKKKSASVNTGSSGTNKKMKELSVSNLDGLADSKSRPFVAFQDMLSSNWRKPWSFCFDMPVSENGSHHSQNKEQENVVPKPIIVQRNDLENKTA